MENFNFFQQQFWNSNKNLLHQAHQQQQQQPPNARGEITSSEKGAMSSGPGSVLAPSKLAQAQPPHSTNRDLTSLSVDNRLYLDGLRHQQQARQNSFTNGSLTISPAGGSSRDNNNNNGLSNQSIAFSSQKLLNRLDIDTLRNNVNSHRSGGSCSGPSNLIHHQHGTILFNTLNGGALGAGSSSSMMQGSSADCFNGPDLVDSTTPPPTAISMPPASSASSSSSTISTNLGLNRNSSQDGNPEKIKTPNSIRGEHPSEKSTQSVCLLLTKALSLPRFAFSFVPLNET